MISSNSPVSHLPIQEISDKTILPPANQPNFIELYDDLKTAFKNHNADDNHLTTIKISARTFVICWTKSDSWINESIWGEIEIENDSLDLMMVDGVVDKQTHWVVRLGMMDKFPLTRAVVYYSYGNDMLYYYPIEGFAIDPKRPRFQVYPYRPLGELVEEFA